MELTGKEQTAYTRAQEQHYVVIEPGQQQLDHAYHEYCVSAQAYSIRIVLHPLPCTDCRIGEEHATVWYDLFQMRQALTPEAYQTVRDYYTRSRPGNYRNARIHLGEVGGFGIVPEYAAQKVAKALSELFSNPITHSQEMFYHFYPAFLQTEQ